MNSVLVLPHNPLRCVWSIKTTQTNETETNETGLFAILSVLKFLCTNSIFSCLIWSSKLSGNYTNACSLTMSGEKI